MPLVEQLTTSLMAVCRRLPAPLVRHLGRSLGWLWYHCVPIRRQESLARIRQAMKLNQRDAIAVLRGMHFHLAESMVELLRFGGSKGLPLAVDYRGGEHLMRALSRERGVLLLTGHMGNWELLVRFGAALPRPCHVLSKRMRASWAQRAWHVMRAGGASIVHVQGGSRSILQALRRNEIIGFALDQHAPEQTAIKVPFLGDDAWTTTALIRYAVACDTPIIPMFSWRSSTGRHVVEVSPEIEFDRTGPRDEVLHRGTLACNRSLERQVKRHPVQWLWLHRRWKEQRGPKAISSTSHSATTGFQQL